ncbi:MAG TPA: hypothetical protein VFD70_08395 [Anaerolineae bacterium]|nr:hypothetical protein [Anaerolineae bacterium]
MAQQQVDIRSEMPVFQAQRAKVEAFVVLQELPRSFDDMLDRLTKTAISLRKGSVSKDEAVRILAEIIRRDIPELRINLMADIKTALDRMDEVNNRLANELVQTQIEHAHHKQDGLSQ